MGRAGFIFLFAILELGAAFSALSWASTLESPQKPLLKVVTFNTHGLPAPLSQFKPDRMASLCEKLKAAYQDPNGWDVVFLQEVWMRSDHELLSHCGYPRMVSLDQRDYDSGVLILSRYQMVGAERKVYSVGGSPLFPVDGEILARKSALAAWVIHPHWGRILLGNTHLVANYSPWGARYSEQRKTQFVEFTDFIRKKAGSWPTIIGGDWNFGPYGPSYERIWDLLGQYLPGFKTAPYEFGTCTVCSPNEGKLDHVFASSHFEPMDARAVFNSKIKVSGIPTELSDHYGWEVTFGAM